MTLKPVMSMFATELDCLRARDAWHVDRIDELERDLAHWKNNHETEVRRARALKERPDMPLERVEAYEKWGEDRAQIRALTAANARLARQLTSLIDTHAERISELVSVKAWREAVIEACVISCLDWNEDDPRATVRRLLDWNAEIALDPCVSERAQALIEQGRGEPPRPLGMIAGSKAWYRHFFKKGGQ